MGLLVRTILKHSHRFDFNVRDNSGWTAYMYACEKGHKDIIEMLEKYQDEHSKEKGMYILSKFNKN